MKKFKTVKIKWEKSMELKELTEEQLENIAAKIDNEGFWYQFAHGGWVKPEDVLNNEDDIKKVKDAINTLREFENICPTL
jgi:RecJ-like exonuclease